MSLRDEIRGAFANVGLQQVNDDILSKCVGLASTLHTSPSQMAEIWEAHSLNKNVTELTDHTFQAYRCALMKEADVADATANGAVVSRPGLGKRNIPMVTPTPNKRSQGRTSNTSSVDAVAARVSISPTKSPSAATPQFNMPKYNERTNVGKVVSTYNPHDLPPFETDSAAATSPRCVVSSSFATNVDKPYRHMFTTLEERAKALDDHLVTLGEDIVERFGIDKDEENGVAPLEAVGIPRQEKICCIGRICNEAHEGRINLTSVLLEGCRHLSAGTRVNVDLSQLKESKASFSLFPGQIVCVEGINSSGRKIVAHRICEGAAHAPEKSPVQTLMRFHHDVQDGHPLKLLSVCGPYTTSDNLDYEPLLDLLQGIVSDKPDVVVLAGPFVDMKHKTVESGDMLLEVDDGGKVCLDYETFFANKIAALIEDAYETQDLNTQFVLVPSLDDANAEWVYPQAPLTDRNPNGAKAIKLPGAEGIEFGTLGLQHIETAGGRVSSKDSRRVHCVSNPCTFKVNEVVIGVTSTDTLFHINSDETGANLEAGTRLARVAQHLLQQRSYYPLFPPALDTNLDLKHMDKWSMPCQPDVLIVPSKLTCFARTVLDKTVVVNPGKLSRGTTGGTYAVMDIHPIKRDTLENAGGADVEMEHNIQDRIRVDIKRI